MNIFEIQSRLQDFSKDQLVKEMQQPSGVAPPFLVMTELQRRTRQEKMANAAAQAPQTTVADDAVAAAGVPQGGIADMARAMAPKTDIAQNTGATTKMQDGGLARASNRVEDYGLFSDPAFMLMAERRGMSPQEYLESLQPEAQASERRRVQRNRMLEMEPEGDGVTFPTQEDLDNRYRMGQRREALDALGIMDIPRGLEGYKTGVIDVADRPAGEAGMGAPRTPPMTARMQEGINTFDPMMRGTEGPQEAPQSFSDIFAYAQPGPEVGGPGPTPMEAMAGVTQSAASLRSPRDEGGILYDPLARSRGSALGAARDYSPRPPLPELAAPSAAGLAPTIDPQAEMRGGPGDVMGEIPQVPMNAMEQLYASGAIPVTDREPLRVGPPRRRNAPIEPGTTLEQTGLYEVGMPPPDTTMSPEQLYGGPLDQLYSEMPPSPAPEAAPPSEPPTQSEPPAPDSPVTTPASPTGGASGSAVGMSAIAPPQTDDDRMLEQDKWLALARFGMALAASNKPFLAAVGEAGQVGIDALSKARDDYLERKEKAELMALKRAELALRGRSGGGGGKPRMLPAAALKMYDDQIEALQMQLNMAQSPAEEMQIMSELGRLSDVRTAMQAQFLAQYNPELARLSVAGVNQSQPEPVDVSGGKSVWDRIFGG